MKYISIPEEVDAIQLSLTTALSELPQYATTSNLTLRKDGTVQCVITAGNVQRLVLEGDYIVKDSEGNVTVMKPEKFSLKYVAKEEA